MPKISMKEAQPLASRKSRSVAEHEAVDGLRETGHSRLRMGKTEQMFFRVTPQKREQLKRLADFLSVGQPQTVSYTQTIEQALDALEEKLKLKK